MILLIKEMPLPKKIKSLLINLIFFWTPIPCKELNILNHRWYAFLSLSPPKKKQIIAPSACQTQKNMLMKQNKRENDN